jgi:GGDEF domain-containing protein
MKKPFMHLLGKMRSTGQAITKSPIKTVYGRKEFIDLIELERDRVHRDDQQFSLILISVDGNENRNDHLIELVHKITKRVRRIDQIGWYDNTHIGVLLPNTTSKGAQIIAKEICRNQDGSNNPIFFKTLSYPDKLKPGYANDSNAPL